MKALILGGYGHFGLPTAKQLARYDLIDEIIIAGRSLEKAQQAAVDVGPKARGLQLDADNIDDVVAALRPMDMLVSFMWNRKKPYQEPLIAAAVRAGSHYCSLGGPPPPADLDSAAREAGVTALVGIGSAPGSTDLMKKQAFSMLDEVDEALSGFCWALLQDIWDNIYQSYFTLPGGVDRGPQGHQPRATLGAPASQEARLAAIRDNRVVEFYLYLMSEEGPPQVQVPAVRGADLVRVDPLLDGVDMPLGAPMSRFAPVPIISPDPPAELYDVPHQGVDIAGFSQAFTDLIQATAARLRAGELDYQTAVAEVYRKLEADLADYLLPTELFASMPGYFITVYGRKDGRPARAALWVPQAYYTQRNWVDMTAAAAAVSVMRVLRGQIDARGAYPNLAEVDSLNDAQLAEIQSLLPDVPQGVPYVDKRVDFLDEDTRTQNSLIT